MFRKALLFVTAAGTLGGALLVPTSAPAKPKCQQGRSDQRYCPKVCTVPYVRGDTIPQANEALKDNNCKPGRVREVSCGYDCGGVAPGRVCATDPPAGTELPDGSHVELIVRKHGGHD